MADYVDNKVFFETIKEYKKSCIQSENSGEEYPEIPEYVGECFLKIAEGLSNRPNFINYTFRDEMVMDGVENCVRYCKNFDPQKSKNPFSYFTQIVYYAFLRRIEREKKQTYVKYKVTETSGISNELATFDDPESRKMFSTYKKNYDSILEYEKRLESKSSKNKKASSTLEGFMDD